MSELVQVTFEEPSIAKLSNSGIRVIKNKTLLAPGFWNGRHYTKEEIVKAYNNTDWNDKDTISLIADHRDDDSKGRPLTIRDWLGFVSNQYLTDDGYVKGDLNFCDSELALKLVDGEAPFGISPFVQGKYDKLDNSQKDFIFKNFAVVVEPACKECYINEYLEDDGLNKQIKELTTEQRMELKNKQKLSQSSTDVDTNVLKGGKKLMEENQPKDEKVEQVENVEENKESVEKSEEPSEQVEEETEDKLVEQIANLTGKLMNKRKLTPEMAKMQKLEKEVTSLKNMIAKLQEAKEESKEEPKDESKDESEKLSAKPKSVMTSAPSEDIEFKGLFKKGASQGTKDAFHKLSSLGVFR